MGNTRTAIDNVFAPPRSGGTVRKRPKLQAHTVPEDAFPSIKPNQTYEDSVNQQFDSTSDSKQKRQEIFRYALQHPNMVAAERCRRSYYYFIQHFWHCISSDTFQPNWHIEYLANLLMKVADRVSRGLPKEHDIVVTIPPGTTKSITCSIMFPVWCWLKWPWMRFICVSYSGALSLEHAEYCRDLVRSDDFRAVFPNLFIKLDKDTKANFRIMNKVSDRLVEAGGSRYSTSISGTVMGFHGHILIVDDPLDPNSATSETDLRLANHFMDNTLPMRAINKAVTPTILIMQRLHQDDPAGHIINKSKEGTFHVSLPAEIRNYKQYLKPEELESYYQDDLLDPYRMPWTVLQKMETALGQYGYAAQMGQNPVPPGGGMFKVAHFQIIDSMPPQSDIVLSVRYWDKAGSRKGKGPFTASTKMHRLRNGKFLVSDAKRGRWSSDERESIIRETAEVDGLRVKIYHEQEPGSGGLESAEGTTLNLAGFIAAADRPIGDKIFRADRYSVQVNNGNILLLRGDWNREFIEEHRFFPFGTYKDQVDSASGAFIKLVKNIAGPRAARV